MCGCIFPCTKHLKYFPFDGMMQPWRHKVLGLNHNSVWATYSFNEELEQAATQCKLSDSVESESEGASRGENCMSNAKIPICDDTGSAPAKGVSASQITHLLPTTKDQTLFHYLHCRLDWHQAECIMTEFQFWGKQFLKTTLQHLPGLDEYECIDL